MEQLSRFAFLFYECYKHGVEDASRVSDDNRCAEYVDRMCSTHVYRLVGQDYDMTWKEWRIRMVVYSSTLSARKEQARRYLMGVDRYGFYAAVALRAGMEFYVQGVRDFTNYPVYAGLELFLADKHMRRWAKGFEHSLYRKLNDILEEMTMLLYDRVRYDAKVVDEEREGRSFAMTTNTYNLFIEIMYSRGLSKPKPKWEEFGNGQRK